MPNQQGGPRAIPVIWKRCLRCNAAFPGIAKSKYCRAACRVAAFRARKQAELVAEVQAPV